MTTPRVTVPVEPTEAMLEAGTEFLNGDRYALARPAPVTAKSFWSAMIAAAPAPDALRVAVEALEAARKVIELFRDEDVLSEGVHTGLRKGTDAKDAHDLWAAIRNSKTRAWSDAIAFALDPYFSMWGGDAALTKIDQALAALQAEQGAK